MSKDYQILREFLLSEKQRQEGYYRYRPAERQAAMQKMAARFAALERLRRAAEWKAAGRWWTDKFD